MSFRWHPDALLAARWRPRRRPSRSSLLRRDERVVRDGPRVRRGAARARSGAARSPPLEVARSGARRRRRPAPRVPSAARDRPPRPIRSRRVRGVALFPPSPSPRTIPRVAPTSTPLLSNNHRSRSQGRAIGNRRTKLRRRRSRLRRRRRRPPRYPTARGTTSRCTKSRTTSDAPGPRAWKST